MPKLKLHNYINIALIIIWMLVIFNFSNQNGQTSSGLSDKIIIKIAEIINENQLSPEEKAKIIIKYKYIVRKSAHFIAYFILGLLMIILLKDLKGVAIFSFLFSLSFCFLYACTDELHQLFIKGRNCNFIDIFIDTSGAFLAISLVYLLKFVKKRHITTK